MSKLFWRLKPVCAVISQNRRLLCKAPVFSSPHQMNAGVVIFPFVVGRDSWNLQRRTNKTPALCKINYGARGKPRERAQAKCNAPAEARGISKELAQALNSMRMNSRERALNLQRRRPKHSAAAASASTTCRLGIALCFCQMGRRYF